MYRAQVHSEVAVVAGDGFAHLFIERLEVVKGLRSRERLVRG
jgi:hypothetical protein